MISEPTKLLERFSINQKPFLTDRDPGIQFQSCHNHSLRSLFLKENMLLFVSDGAVTIRYGRLNYYILKNQIAFLKKDVLIEIQATASQSDELVRTEYILICIKNELIKEFTKMIQLSFKSTQEPIPVSVSIPGKRVQGYFHSMNSDFNQSGMPANLVKIKQLELLFHLAENEEKVFEQFLDLRENYRTDITSVVEKNVMNTITLSELAHLSGRSMSSFRRDFLEIYNMPPSQWIRQKRLEKAREMLQSTTMTITDICFNLGFKNIAHFSRLFKSYFKCPPTEYRINCHMS